MTNYFSDAELFAQCTADERHDCCLNYKENMEKTIELANKVREAYGAPIQVNSFFRSKEHNARVGGQPTSQHLEAGAIDIAPLASDHAKHPLHNALMIFNACKYLIRNGRATFGQVILYPTFVHISIYRGTHRNMLTRHYS